MSENGTVKILFIAASGSGSAAYIDVPAGSSIADVFNDRIDGNPEAYNIRVNNGETLSHEAWATTTVEAGMRVAVTPNKMIGN